MANNTVYPFGTDGTLPSSTGIKNDLVSGGTGQALSAEQGLVLNYRRTATKVVDANDNSFVVYKDNVLLYAQYNAINKDIDELGTLSYSGWRCVKIPIEGVKELSYYAYGSGNGYGCVFIDDNDIVLTAYNYTSNTSVERCPVPYNAKYFVFNYSTSWSAQSRQVTLYGLAEDEVTVTELNKKLCQLNGDTQSFGWAAGKFVHLQMFRQGNMAFDGFPIGGTFLDKTWVPGSQDNAMLSHIFLVDVAGCKTITFPDFLNSSHVVGHLFLDADYKVVAQVTANGKAMRTIRVPEGARYFAWDFLTTNSTWTWGEGVITLAYDTVIQSENDVVVDRPSGSRLSFKQGAIGESGEVDGSSGYITSSVIYGPHLIELNDGFLIRNASLYDRDGNMVAYRYINSVFSYPPTRGGTKHFASTAKYIADYGYRYEIRKSDNSNIYPSDNPVKKLHMLDDIPGLVKYIPDDIAPYYEIVQRRMKLCENAVWKAIVPVPEAGVSLDNFHRAGDICIGPPYSQPYQYQKFFPQDVSARTFLTALLNKRSLIYTEVISSAVGAHSEYGISYTGDTYRKAYYGAVCSSFVDYILGLKPVYMTSDYSHTNSSIDITSVGDPTLATLKDVLKPFDILHHNGHVTIVSDMLLDEYGHLKYIIMDEMTGPGPFRAIYAPEDFMHRFTEESYSIRRYSGWNKTATVDIDDDSASLVPINREDCIVKPICSEDIQTFAGDYATFETGDKIILNARRGGIYTGANVYKNGTLVDTIDITGLSNDTIYSDSATEDWILITLTGTLSAGKYEVRLTDGTNETVGTFFEVIGITLTISGGNVSFSATDGAPIYMQREGEAGMPNGQKALTPEEIESGTISLPWSYSSSVPYLKLVVQGDYGTAMKRILYPTT